MSSAAGEAPDVEALDTGYAGTTIGRAENALRARLAGPTDDRTNPLRLPLGEVGVDILAGQAVAGAQGASGILGPMDSAGPVDVDRPLEGIEVSHRAALGVAPGHRLGERLGVAGRHVGSQGRLRHHLPFGAAARTERPARLFRLLAECLVHAV